MPNKKRLHKKVQPFYFEVQARGEMSNFFSDLKSIKMIFNHFGIS